MKSQCSFLAIFLFLVSLSSIQSKFFIQSPSALEDFFQQKYGEEGIPYSIANYGEVPYGKTISGTISIPSVLEDCVYEDVPSLQKTQIIMAQRFECTFTQKSINIQKEGGKLAIIMDNVVQEPRSIVMVDDGYGFQVHIPTILISNQDGQQILKYKEQGVIVGVHFDVQTRKKAKIQFWIDITDHKNMVFLRAFQPFFNKLSTHIDAELKFPISPCSLNCEPDHCLNFHENDNSNMTYCRFPKPQEWWIQNAGKTIIEEQFFQHFLFKDDQKAWWKYILQFDDTCPGVSFFKICRQTIVKKLNTDSEHLNTHMASMMANEGNSQETLLRQWQTERKKHGIIYYPSIIVNKIVYRGNLEPVDVFELICQSLNPQPSGCQSSDDDSSEISLISVVIAASVLGVSFIIFLLCCFRRIAKRQISSQMHGQVNALVNEYITMFQERKFQGQQDNIELQQKLKEKESQP